MRSGKGKNFIQNIRIGTRSSLGSSRVLCLVINQISLNSAFPGWLASQKARSRSVRLFPWFFFSPSNFLSCCIQIFSPPIDNGIGAESRTSQSARTGSLCQLEFDLNRTDPTDCRKSRRFHHHHHWRQQYSGAPTAWFELRHW